MGRHLYHEQPDLMEFEGLVVDSRPGAVLLDRTAFYPGGGGQLADKGHIEWSGGTLAVTAIEPENDRLWHVLDGPVEVSGTVLGRVDREFRRTMCALHTSLHILNALVFQRFAGALVTGVQMGVDETARIDFDLPDADNNRLRALEDDLNRVVRDALEVRPVYLPLEKAEAEAGLIRSRSVTPPPTDDGLIRIVEIVGLDRQACGGTHLSNTAEAPALRILKIENKGRHNRRVRIGLDRSTS